MGVQVGVCVRTIAVAALLLAGAAEAAETRAALYGDLRYSFDYTDDGSTANGPIWTTTDNQSTWGLKLSTARGGVTVFGAYERYVETDDPALPGVPVELTRQAFVGLTSMCGTIKVGRHATAYSEAGRKLDPFYDTAVSGSGGVIAAGSIFGGGNSHGTSTAFNADALGGAYVADHLAYTSPAFDGLSGNIAVFLDETAGTQEQRHDYGLGLEWAGSEGSAQGVTAGIQFIDANGANALTWGTDVTAARMHVGYVRPNYGAGVSWERLDLGPTTQNFTMLSGWYGLGEHTRIAASIGNEDDSFTDGDSLRVGLFHDLFDEFTVWAAALHYDQGSGVKSGSDVVTFGASYKFSLGFKPD